MDTGGSSAHANGDDGASPSGVGGGDSNAVLRSLTQQVMTKIARSSTEQGGPTTDQGCTIEKFTKMNPPAESKIVEFLNLRQGQLTVQQYAAKFIELPRFAPYINLDEVKKVAVLKVQELSELVDRATVAEESSKMDAGTSSLRKRPGTSGFQAGSIRGPWRGDRYNRAQSQETRRQKVQGKQAYPTCPICGKRHWGECRAGRNVYYRCGGPGHVARDCHMQYSTTPTPRTFGGNIQAPRGGGQQRNTAPMRVNALTLGDAKATSDVVTGMTTALSYKAIVLFDLGATHLFVSWDISSLLEL
ncbi:uncharacterized protein LOC131156019 [Malania oleifera]|uniref:uncharacterized protein LOC131156019 n=1 Tax=Malania oleifera TaxID=397392 RepID=UPI0025AE00F6|nr:uncharacterized protein LOC131156019 [Malania oleifera]